MSIGLCNEAQPLLGVVAAPALGIVWAGAPEHGATRNGAPCHVSACAELAEVLCATGFGYAVHAAEDNNVPEFEAVLSRSHGIRRCGAAAIDLALVADGTFDLYWEQRLSPWDLAAGSALVLAASRRTSDYAGRPADPRTGWVVASNDKLHQEALGTIQRARDGRLLLP